MLISNSFVLYVSAMLSLGVPFVLAANDWSTACLTGSCTYEAGDGINSAFSLLAINGSSTTLSDITPAAGWSITGCSANSSAPQTIQVTCDPSGANAPNCEHLIAGNPVNKVIRLPESCGAGPFARVAAWSNSTGAKRDGGVVQTCTFDYNFTQIPTTQSGLSFSVYGTSSPGVLGNISGLAQTALESQKRAFPRRGLAPRSFVSSIISAISAATTIDEKFTTNQAVNFAPGKAITLLDESIACGKVKEQLKITVNPTLKSQIAVAFAVQGQLVPPKLQDIALNAKLNADTTGIFDVTANLNGAISSKAITLFSVGIPGLDVPGIFSLGPTFSINAQVSANAGASFASKITIQDSITGLTLNFPPQAGKSSLGQNKVVNSNLKLSVDTTGTLAGDLKADLIPKVDFGINVLNGLVKSTVFLQADLGADLKASVSATKSKSSSKSSGQKQTGGSNSTIHSNTTTIGHNNTTSIVGNNSTSLVGNNSTSLNNSTSAGGNLTSTISNGGNSTSGGSGVAISGSVELDLGVAVTAGADANLLDLFDASKTIGIFDKSVTLFKKSFGKAVQRRKARSRKGGRSSRHLPQDTITAKRALQCSVSLTPDLSIIV